MSIKKEIWWRYRKLNKIQAKKDPDPRIQVCVRRKKLIRIRAKILRIRNTVCTLRV